MNIEIQNPIRRNAASPQAPPEKPRPEISPPSGPKPEIPRESPPMEIPRESPPMEIPPKPQRDLPMEEPERANHPLRAMTVPSYATLASLSLALTSLLVLDGCAAIEGIFKAGIGVGALVVITIVAVLGGIAALVFRR